MANLMLVQCVIESHAEVWTCQFEFQVEQLFLAVPQGCLRFVIVVFPDHTHLLFLVEILSGVDSDHGTGPRRNRSVKVNNMSNRKKVMLTKDAPLSSHLAVYIL